MGLFTKSMEPTFLKKSEDTQKQINELELLLGRATGNLKSDIERDIKLLMYGLSGEKNIEYELKNSHIPCYILHDVYIEDDGLTAQIDYIVVTQKRIFVIECKNLYGDIEINNKGEFIRTYKVGGRVIKEGIYSPITQNRRHMELIKKIRSKEKGLIARSLFERAFSDVYRSIIVLSNSKSVLNTRYAPKQVKDSVIRADQLVEHIIKVNNEPGVDKMSTEAMEDLAIAFLRMNIKERPDYAKRYRDMVDAKCEAAANGGRKMPKEGQVGITVEEKEAVPSCNDRNAASLKVLSDAKRDSLIKKLKEYRMQVSKKEGIKPYFVFTDKQMEEIIDKFPESEQDLIAVNGFGDAKCRKYGKAIVDIFANLER